MSWFITLDWNSQVVSLVLKLLTFAGKGEKAGHVPVY